MVFEFLKNMDFQNNFLQIIFHEIIKKWLLYERKMTFEQKLLISNKTVLYEVQSVSTNGSFELLHVTHVPYFSDSKVIQYINNSI